MGETTNLHWKISGKGAYDKKAVLYHWCLSKRHLTHVKRDVSTEENLSFSKIDMQIAPFSKKKKEVPLNVMYLNTCSGLSGGV